MGAVAIQPDILDLLTRAGAQPPRYGRGKWTCPNHPGSASVSVDAERGLFNCHHHGCDFRGGIGMLRKRLGIPHEWLPPGEYIRQRREREQAADAATAFLETYRAERLRVYAELRELAQLENAAHTLGPDSETAWGALNLVCSRRPVLTAEAALFSEGSIADRRRWLEADSAERGRVIDGILAAGGLADDTGRFVAMAF